MSQIDTKEYKNFHFIGIGGIGMSALARLLKSQGKNISGSDSSNSEIVEALLREGVKIKIGHSEKNILTTTDCIIYTLAISKDNPEFLYAKKIGLPLFTYAEMLGQVSKGMQTIAVSGTHGKTTTTAMLNSCMRAAGVNPNMIVGSLISQEKTNFLSGEGRGENIFITEACEYKKSFLNLSPDILVITNIEEDHLDYYKDLDDIKNAFMDFANKVPDDGKIICNFQNKNLYQIINKHKNKCIDFSCYIQQVPQLLVFGKHNIENAAAALAVVYSLHLPIEELKKGLATFTGTWRRLEFRGQNINGALVYDDYGHHPTEIAATLSALREKYPDKKIKVFFQPHLYSRTKLFFDDFVDVLSGFDKVYFLPIYAAREIDDGTVSSEKIANKISGAESLADFEDARKKILNIKDDSIILTLGAGDVYLILK